MARWIALIRFAAAWLAGINRMKFTAFFFWNALGGITWAITYGLVGYFAGEGGAKVLAKLGIAGGVFFALLIIALFVFVKLRERKAERKLEQGPDSAPDLSQQ